MKKGARNGKRRRKRACKLGMVWEWDMEKKRLVFKIG